MSKLAHSNQEAMDELDRRRAIENGDEDLLGNYVALPEQGQAARQPQQLSAFTPGPWIHDESSSSRAVMVYSDDRTGSAIAKCQLEYVARSYDECVANARLITAAPDMYAAMEEIEWIFDGKEDITDNGGPNDAMRALATVRAAIRKARGSL